MSLLNTLLRRPGDKKRLGRPFRNVVKQEMYVLLLSVELWECGRKRKRHKLYELFTK